MSDESDRISREVDALAAQHDRATGKRPLERKPKGPRRESAGMIVVRVEVWPWDTWDPWRPWRPVFAMNGATYRQVRYRCDYPRETATEAGRWADDGGPV